MSQTQPIINRGQDAALAVEGISKTYGAVQALQDVSLSVSGAEVVALLGDNGAGKSTLVKIIAGSVIPDEGRILVDGELAEIGSPEDSRELGIETVYQNLALCDQLDVSGNLFLNRELILGHGKLAQWVGWLNRRSMNKETLRILAHLEIDLPNPRQTVENLSGGQRQAIAVGKSVAWGQHIVLMDEPVAALGVKESRHVLELVDRLRTQGVAILLISHNMEDVLAVCDRAVVLRHGRKVADVNIADTTREALVGYITSGRASN